MTMESIRANKSNEGKMGFARRTASDAPRTAGDEWTNDNWRARPRNQMPDYPDPAALGMVETQLRALPSLVSGGEVRALRAELASVARGEAFVIQGGDCAETFAEFSGQTVRDTFRVLLQMAIVLTYSAKVPTVKIGRIAGQFAKPRSSPTERRGDVELPSYRGDIVNGTAFTADERMPDPSRMLKAYLQSAASLNLIRSISKGGFANLRQLHAWTLGFTDSVEATRYRAVARHIQDSLDFMAAAGLSADANAILSTVDFYTSHEALLLNYEEALTRRDPVTGETFAGSGHMIWIGDRTRQPDGAHVEYCRGVANPIGVKCGPSLTADDLRRLLDLLNPRNEAGRITLITRFGADALPECLPQLIRAVEMEGADVVWSCDPMHGNTHTVPSGYKTRAFGSIRREIADFFGVHRAEGTHPGGIHLEMTGNDVTECTGGMHALSDTDLAARYATACDPRLNADQALELTFLIAENL